ncbi:hypothetical protein JZU48_00305 [bacterium]|jgi:hypothetical protein|nr:hypothetical protein [bacterium]
MIHRGRLEELLSALLGQRALLERLVRLSPHDPAWAEQRLAVTARIVTLEAALAAPARQSCAPLTPHGVGARPQ